MTKIFDINRLSENLKQAKEVDFAYLFGSARDGVVGNDSDIDIAVYLNCECDLDVLCDLSTLIEKSTGVECDLSILNTTSPVLGMEVIKGKLLFVKKDKVNAYVNFYAQTCRKYEDVMFEMELNLKYRGY